MKRLSTLFLAAAMCVSSMAHAVVETNRTPSHLGIRPSTNLAYVSLVEPLTTACGANVIWIHLDDNGGLGKTAYASILVAKAMGKRLSYLEYTVDTFGNCYLVQVEVE